MGDYIPTEPLVEAQAAAMTRGGFSRDIWILMALAVQITFLRTYSRWRMVGWRKFQADDVLVWLALGLHGGVKIIDVQLVEKYKGLANDFPTVELRDSLDPEGEEFRLRTEASMLRLVEWPMYALLLWSLKASMAVLYLRLMGSLEGYRRRIYILFALMLVTFGIMIIVPVSACHPVQKMWQIVPDPGPLCYPESAPSILWTVLGCNIITDMYLFWLPIPMILESSLATGTKLALGCLFGCGLFVTMAATVRITLLATATHSIFAISFWSNSETFVAIVTTNIPAIFVLWRRWCHKLFPASSLGRRREITQKIAIVSNRVKTFLNGRNSIYLPDKKPLERYTRRQSSRVGKKDGQRVPAHGDDHVVGSISPHHPQHHQFTDGSPTSNIHHSRQRSVLLAIDGFHRSSMPSVQEVLWNNSRRSVNTIEDILAEEGLVLREPSKRPPLTRKASTATGKDGRDRPGTAESAAGAPPLSRKGSCATRRGSSATRRGGHERSGTATSAVGPRKQVDIMVVEEALRELGTRSQLDTLDLDDGHARKALPRLPDAVKDKKPLPNLPNWRT